jgi:hypothetical protein
VGWEPQPFNFEKNHVCLLYYIATSFATLVFENWEYCGSTKN